MRYDTVKQVSEKGYPNKEAEKYFNEHASDFQAALDYASYKAAMSQTKQVLVFCLVRIDRYRTYYYKVLNAKSSLPLATVGRDGYLVTPNRKTFFIQFRN